MAQLDTEEQAARGAIEPERLSSAEVVAYMSSRPSLWADAGPEGRQGLATTLFGRTDVLWFQRMEYELTPDTVEIGLGAALAAVFEMRPRRSVSLVGARGFEPPTSSSRTMRATKLRHAPTEGARLTEPADDTAGPVKGLNPITGRRPGGLTGSVAGGPADRRTGGRTDGRSQEA
jgi:hypothetical protein